MPWFGFLQTVLVCHSNKQEHQNQLLQAVFHCLCSCTQNMLQMIHNALGWECWSMARRQPSIMDSPFPLMMMALPTVATEIKQLTVDYQVQPPLSAVNKNIKNVLKYCKLISYACNANRGSSVQRYVTNYRLKQTTQKPSLFAMLSSLWKCRRIVF